MFIEDGLTFGKYEIKPSYKKNIDAENDFVRENVSRIATLFRLRERNIFQWSYIVQKVSSKEKIEQIRNEIDEFVAILRYTQLKKLHESNQFEHYNYFFFELPKKDYIEEASPFFYSGVLNLEQPKNFYILDKVAKEPYHATTVSSAKILTRNEAESDEVYTRFYSRHYTELAGKFLRSIKWFNRSFSHSVVGIDPSESIINMHTALEALLTPEDGQHRVKTQVQTALYNLLDHPGPYLVWHESFWELRNAIVHGSGKARNFEYVPKGGKRGTKSHVYFARRIYILCFDALLNLNPGISFETLKDELESNEIRVISSIKEIKKIKSTNPKKLRNTNIVKLISRLRTDELSATKKEVKDLGDHLIPWIKYCVAEMVSDTVEKKKINMKVEEISTWKGDKYYELALLYTQLQELFEPLYMRSTSSSHTLDQILLVSAINNYISFAGWRLFYMHD